MPLCSSDVKVGPPERKPDVQADLLNDPLKLTLLEWAHILPFE
jgi:hypothetical protein